MWSYSNSGYAILGRLIEVVAAPSTKRRCASRLFTRSAGAHGSFPEDVIPHPHAVGHVANPTTGPVYIVSPQWGLFRSGCSDGPAIVASASDVLRLVSLQPQRGSRAGRHPAAVQRYGSAAIAEQRSVSSTTRRRQRLGLGWLLDTFGDVPVIGHDGTRSGRTRSACRARATIRMCLQTNVESALSMYRELAVWLSARRLGVTPRSDPQPQSSRSVADPGRYVGTYVREGVAGRSGRSATVRSPRASPRRTPRPR